MPQPLAPAEMYPAGHLEISERFLALRSGISVRVAERGPSDGAPVVMLPGWGTPVYMFRHAFDRLPARALRVIGTELRGFGLSSKPRARGAYGIDAYCADVDALLDALALPSALLLGQSMGGGLALHYAMRHPERVQALALVNPTGLAGMPLLRLVGFTPPEVVGLLGRRMTPRWLISFILRNLAYGDASRVSERDVDEYWAPTQLPGFVYAAQSALREFDWSRLSDEAAASIAAPALVILGDSDRLVRSTRGDAERLASASVQVLGGGHCVHEERPDEAYALIGDWFARHGRHEASTK